MKIIFVGIHNKKNKRPLDSSTISGKTIDGVIANFCEFECIKTNLYDTDYMPGPDERHELEIEFFDRVNIQSGDIVVLLGAFVVERMENSIPAYVVKYKHPSPMFSKQGRSEYVRVLTNLIASKIALIVNEKIVVS